MRTLRLHLAYKGIKRLRDIISVMVKHGFQPLMERLHLMGLVSLPQRVMGKKAAREKKELTPAVRLRLALEELGPTFIKFGQILSTRPDIVPDEYLMELLKLQDEVAPFPFREVQGMIEAEFKKPASELFRDIEETPVAAASIAQVHRAVTSGGEEVVIKAQRPGIDDVIDTDISILRYLSRLIVKHIPESRPYDPVGFVEEFARTIKREIDFTLEASYTQRFRENFAGEERVLVPRVYWDLSTKRLLTLERVHGIKADRKKKLLEEGIDTERVAHTIADVFFRQVFEFGLFHGDLHPGNIFVISEEKVAFVDFGIVGRVDRAMRQNLADILVNMVSEDFQALTRVFMRMGMLPEKVDIPAFERDYYDMMLAHLGRPLRYVKIGEIFMDYIKLAARHNIRLPRELLLFDKCLIELEGLAKVLYPEMNIIEESKPYAAKLLRERISPAAVLRDALYTASDYRRLLRELPADTGRIAKKILDDKLRIEFLHRGLEDFMGEVDRSSNRLTFGIIMAALVIGSSLVIASGIPPLVFGYPALGIVGFVIASILGLWIAIQILRSGKF